MALHKFLTIMRRHIRLFLAIALICVIGSAVASSTATRSYTAHAGVYFSTRTADSVDDLAQGATFTREQMVSYASLALTPAVLEPVADSLGLTGGAVALGRQVSVSAPENSVVLELDVVDTDADRAAAIANAVAAQVITVVEDLAPEDPAGGLSGVAATVVAPATVPLNPTSPRTVLDLAAGLVLGLALGVLAALVRGAVDTRVRGVEELAELTDRPLIGTLAAHPRRDQGILLVAEPHSPQAEAYRQLRTNLQFLDVGGRTPDAVGTRTGLRVLTVTSSVAAEGKSTAAVNLAVALAETSARVLLVDADLRRPSIAGLLGLEGAVGLTTVLLGQVDVADVVQDWGTTGLQVLTSGTCPPNPSELLSSVGMRRLLETLREQYDYVVVDSAPLLPVADGAILSGLVDGVVLLANVTKVRRQQLAESLRTLAQVRAPLLGVVLNQVARDGHAYGYPAATVPAGRSVPGDVLAGAAGPGRPAGAAVGAAEEPAPDRVAVR